MTLIDEQFIEDIHHPKRLVHERELQAIQAQIGAIKFQYTDETLAFKALDLAWEAVRMAWYAVHQETLEHLWNVESSLQWVKDSVGGRDDHR